MSLTEEEMEEEEVGGGKVDMKEIYFLELI